MPARNIVIPDANDAISQRREVMIALLVGWTVRVLTTVDLDNQSSFTAKEISIVRAERHLSDKFKPGNLTIAYPVPETRFSIRHR